MTGFETKIIETEQRCKSNTKRIDKLEENIEAIHKLAISTHEIATEMKNMKDDQLEIKQRLCKIENEPNNRLSQIKTAIISALAGAIVSTIVGAVLVMVK